LVGVAIPRQQRRNCHATNFGSSKMMTNRSSKILPTEDSVYRHFRSVLGSDRIHRSTRSRMWRIQAPEIHGNMHYQQRNCKYTSARMNLRYVVVS
jgi:hypothetical protein